VRRREQKRHLIRWAGIEKQGDRTPSESFHWQLSAMVVPASALDFKFEQLQVELLNLMMKIPK
jgi:hypothetical protein